jgi:hypothetical protein
MKKAIVFLAVALALPTSVAFAKSPNAGTKGKSNPKVMYVLKGTLSNYTAATTADGGVGQISILVKHSNYHAKALKSAGTLTFATSMSTRAPKLIPDGSKGVIKFKAPLRVTAGTNVATMVQTTARALHIINQSH